MMKRFANIFLCAAIMASIGLTVPTLAQVPSAPVPTATGTNPGVLTPSGITSSGATRLRLVADEQPAPAAASTLPPTAVPLSTTPSLTAPTPASIVPPPPPRAMPTLKPGSTASGGDPTVPGPAIRELLGQGERTNQAAPAAPPSLPVVRLRARIVVRDKPPVAIVEIDGRMFSLREGVEFTVPSEGTPTPMKVVRLSATEMQLEIVNRRAVINLN